MTTDKLWTWFSLSYASFLTLPRVLMHEMPNEWQDKMTDLLEEYEETFPGVADLPSSIVQAKKGNLFCKWPSWLLNYRHPEKAEIDKMRGDRP